ncbi:conserved protein of unknown function [Denitratisoma oestradiolicum]|uniref:Uncharacterized protein n=1 Tax=Denitratisoma oestradiolicum TaxID=311182 RepID=A0A6S6YCC3_9PROT|nr:conserved protein of unknown function [Denitratisoma oestradiolicum]
MVPMAWIEHATSPLPRECSTTELHGQNLMQQNQSPARLPGAGDEVRTRDILLGRQVLYQLSYTRSIPTHTHKNMGSLTKLWWRGKDSNLRRQSRQIYSLIPLTAREPLLESRALSRSLEMLSNTLSD